jgi:hypothetical protein
MGEDSIDYAKAYFRMPNPVKVTGRTSSVTNSFINSIIPVIVPTSAEVKVALDILEMSDGAECAYCGDAFTEWDHLRPLVVAKLPTGQISEIRNLVPACGKCNQSKGNKPWRTWMFGSARLSPLSRGIPDIEDRARRLERYAAWGPRAPVDFEAIVGPDLWAKHWAFRAQLEALMRDAQLTAEAIRVSILDAFASLHVEGAGVDHIQ